VFPEVINWCVGPSSMQLLYEARWFLIVKFQMDEWVLILELTHSRHLVRLWTQLKLLSGMVPWDFLICC
jgi:hypothetical protein